MVQDSLTAGQSEFTADWHTEYEAGMFRSFYAASPAKSSLRSFELQLVKTAQFEQDFLRKRRPEMSLIRPTKCFSGLSFCLHLFAILFTSPTLPHLQLIRQKDGGKKMPEGQHHEFKGFMNNYWIFLPNS